MKAIIALCEEHKIACPACESEKGKPCKVCDGTGSSTVVLQKIEAALHAWVKEQQAKSVH